MTGGVRAVLLAPGVWQVDIDGRRETVYVAASSTERWACCRGEVAIVPVDGEVSATVSRSREKQTALRAPMPARILKVNVAPGARVSSGETLVIVEAMKMELPLRAVADARVSAVHVEPGQLVTPDTVLIDFDAQVEA